MSAILKTVYKNGNVITDVSLDAEPENYVFEIYQFDFLKAEYPQKPNISKEISEADFAEDIGYYRLKSPIPNRSKIKCVVSESGKYVASKERYFGDKRTIKIETKETNLGCMYRLKSDTPITRKAIFYKSPISDIKVNIPEDIEGGKTRYFTINSGNFKPQFEIKLELTECFVIEN